jgi:DNA modification methylase
VWGDKKFVLPSLLNEFAGQVNLIYIDPPFATGADFSFTSNIPETEESFLKEPSIIEQKAYRDTWGRGLDSYLQWFYETATLLRELLAEDGSLYVHLDWNVGHYAKLVLDEVFGDTNFRNELIWQRTGAHNDALRFGNVHDTIFVFSKSDKWTFNSIYVSHTEEHLQTRFNQVDEKTNLRFFAGPITAPGDGPPRMFRGKLLTPPKGRHWSYAQKAIDELEAQERIYYSATGTPYLKQYMDEYVEKGRRVQSIWTDLLPSKTGSELLNYPTQKPEGLLERIIKASTNEDDLVLDCFCGSGTTAAVAEKLGRRWITCDLGRFAIHTARKRLLSIPDVKPFVVQNLGKYERQAWQAAEFPDATQRSHLQTRYRNFIMELYNATPIEGYIWLHGVKAGRLVHVGSVDAPIALGEVKAIVNEFWRVSGKDAGERSNGVDVLGWDFAFELNETARQMAAEANVKLSFKKIPREVLEKKAVEQGDIRFYELAALDVDLKQTGQHINLELKNFFVPPDDIPQEVQQAIKHWSQWIDYWAVDWDFKDDTFHNQWQSYRTKKEPKIALTVGHTYDQPGEYCIVIKVIDILGNDTTKAVRVVIK